MHVNGNTFEYLAASVQLGCKHEEGKKSVHAGVLKRGLKGMFTCFIHPL